MVLRTARHVHRQRPLLICVFIGRLSRKKQKPRLPFNNLVPNPITPPPTASVTRLRRPEEDTPGGSAPRTSCQRDDVALESLTVCGKSLFCLSDRPGAQPRSTEFSRCGFAQAGLGPRARDGQCFIDNPVRDSQGTVSLEQRSRGRRPLAFLHHPCISP